MKKLFIFSMLFCSLYTSAQVYVYSSSQLIDEIDGTPDSIVTIPPYSTPLPATDEGALTGVFSVSKTRKVRFSKGNLQYLTATKEWRFAEHQYDTIGSDVTNAAFDQFGFGTSGWNGSGAQAYLPTETTTSNDAYYAYVGEHLDNTLTGYMEHRDWGVHNAIANGGNKAGLWRTPLNAEWSYMLGHRWTPYAVAIVDGVWGIVVLPDGWNEEPTLKLRPCYYDRDWKKTTELTEAEIQAILALCNNDTLSYTARLGGLSIHFYMCIPGFAYGEYDGLSGPGAWEGRPIEEYNITPEEWQTYEAKGCVFLPFEKSRSHPENTNYWSDGVFLWNYMCQYWGANGGISGVLLNFIRNSSEFTPYQFTVRSGSALYPSAGGCVRLVQDYE